MHTGRGHHIGRLLQGCELTGCRCGGVTLAQIDRLEQGHDLDTPIDRPVSWLQIVAGEACRPKTANTWQTGFAFLLALLTFGSCLQLGLSSNISLLPAVRLQPCILHHSCVKSVERSCVSPLLSTAP